MLEAVVDCFARVRPQLRTVHRLKKKVVECERGELIGIESLLWEDELQLVAVTKHELRARFRTHAYPIDSGRRFLRAVRLDGDSESGGVQRVDGCSIELQ
jgi:hypothetical protein